MNKRSSGKWNCFQDWNPGLRNPRTSHWATGMGLWAKRTPPPPATKLIIELGGRGRQQTEHIWENGKRKGAGNADLHGVEGEDACLRDHGVRPLAGTGLPHTRVTWSNHGVCWWQILWSLMQCPTCERRLPVFTHYPTWFFTGPLCSSDLEIGWKLETPRKIRT